MFPKERLRMGVPGFGIWESKIFLNHKYWVSSIKFKILKYIINPKILNTIK